ncbi:MAG: hypothetical protein ACE1ZE_06560 [Candidatus Binatia bacterium]
MAGNAPINASVIILLRPDVKGGIELLMTRCPPGEFSVENYAFPLSPVKKEDTLEGMLNRCRGLTLLEARNTLGSELTPQLSLGHWVAAIRGLFEQMGVLLCTTEGGRPLEGVKGSFRDDLIKKRRSLIEGCMDFRTLLESEGLFCDTRCLSYFTHWLTPENAYPNYDARYYVASLPPDQKAIMRSRNHSTGLWITPERGMDLFQQGSFPMVFSTFASVRSLADFDSWDSLASEYRLHA